MYSVRVCEKEADKCFVFKQSVVVLLCLTTFVQESFNRVEEMGLS